MVGSTIFVERVAAPLASKELVETGVHWANGRLRSALASKVNPPFAGPFLAVMVRVRPLTAILVIIGCETSVEPISRT